MKFALATTFAAAASAHYTFDRIAINGQETGNSWQHIMENTRAEKYMPTKFINSFGTTPLDSDFRCNQGAFTNQGNVQVVDVAAGSEMSFLLAYGATMQHPGPSQVYMSQAPGSVAQYDGSGDWFKIHQTGVCNNGGDLTTDAWCTWDQDRITFTIPSSTPSGEYLVRAEHIGLHGAHVGEAEFYYSCALVNVVNGGDGLPGPTVQIPGVYQQDDEAVNFSVWGGGSDYPLIPGPEVWQG